MVKEAFYLTRREPTLPVAPATNTRSLSFELISCLLTSPALASDETAACVDRTTENISETKCKLFIYHIYKVEISMESTVNFLIDDRRSRTRQDTDSSTQVTFCITVSVLRFLTSQTKSDLANKHQGLEHRTTARAMPTRAPKCNRKLIKKST